MDMEITTSDEILDAGWGLPFVHKHFVIWKQLRKGGPPVQIYEHGYGESKHVFYHPGHLLCRHHKKVLE